jgi:hypothetical protein
LVQTKQAGNSPQIFPYWRLLPNRQKSQDFSRVDKSLKTESYLPRQCLMFYEPASVHINNLKESYVFISALKKSKMVTFTHGGKI